MDRGGGAGPRLGHDAVDARGVRLGVGLGAGAPPPPARGGPRGPGGAPRRGAGGGGRPRPARGRWGGGGGGCGGFAGGGGGGWAGHIYCHITETCLDVADLTRAREWSDAANRWLQGFPDAVMFQGVCRAHRAYLLSVEGAWRAAEAEAEKVAEELRELNVAAVAEAEYLHGEVHRV